MKRREQHKCDLPTCSLTEAKRLVVVVVLLWLALGG